MANPFMRPNRSLRQMRVVCKQFEALLAVAAFLQVPIPLDACRVRRPVLLPVVRMLLAPLTGALAARFTVVRISRDLLMTVVGAAPSLALRRATDRLLGLALRGRKSSAAVWATPFDHKGVVPPR